MAVILAEPFKSEVLTKQALGRLRDDNTVSIVDISSWRDYEQDDKIQLTLTDGTVILTEITKVKLIDDTKALDGALIDYATSLVESADNVYYNGEQIKTK